MENNGKQTSKKINKDYMDKTRKQLEEIFRPESVVVFNFHNGIHDIEEKFDKLTEQVKEGKIKYTRAIRQANLTLTLLTRNTEIPRSVFDKFLERYHTFKDECFDYAT